MVNLASFKTQRFQDSGKPIDLGKEEMMVDFDLYMVNFYHSKQTENHFIDVIKMQRNWPKNIYKDRISIMLQRKSLKTKTIFISIAQSSSLQAISISNMRTITHQD